MSLFRPDIDRIAGYVPGEQPQEAGWIKLNTNENPYPPSPRVVAAITAAVVGVILNLTLWFVLHVLFPEVREVRAGPLRWYAFDPASIDLRVAALAVVAAVLAFVFHRGLVQLVAIMAALGIAVRFAL